MTEHIIMLSSSFLMNDFIESFLLVFGKNKYTNTRFQSLKSSKNYSLEYNGYKDLMKYIRKYI